MMLYLESPRGIKNVHYIILRFESVKYRKSPAYNPWAYTTSWACIRGGLITRIKKIKIKIK